MAIDTLGAFALASNSVTTATVADNAVTLAKLEDGTQGDILYYGASGAPARLGYGTDGQILKTQGTGANPAWTDAGGGLFESYAVISDQKAQSTVMQTYTAGAWRVRDINTEIVDPDGIVSISSDRFSLEAGSYLLKSVVAVYHGTSQGVRIYDYTNSAIVGFGLSTYLDAVHNFHQTLHSMCRVTPSGTTEYEIQIRSTATGGGNSISGLQVETYTYVEIYKEA